MAPGWTFALYIILFFPALLVWIVFIMFLGRITEVIVTWLGHGDAGSSG